MSNKRSNKSNLKKLSKNEIRNKNNWKYNLIHSFKYNQPTTNTIEVDKELLRKFKNEIWAFMSKKIDPKNINSKEQEKEAKLVKRSYDRIFTFANILDDKYNTNKSVVSLCKKHRMCKSTYYEILEKYKIWTNSKFYSFNNFLLKSTKPKTIRYRYTHYQIKLMCDFYFNYVYSNFKVKPSIMQIVNELKFERNPEIFSKLSYTTAHKYIKQDERYAKFKQYNFKIKHDRRKKYISTGCIQFDLKIVGIKETHFRTPLIFASMKDESSKLVYGRFILCGSAEEAVRVLYEGYDYFEELGMKIKRIRTDNAMMFMERKSNVSNYKKTNFINCNLFYKFLREKNITHERIPLGQSEANGTIERFHRTIDMEFLPIIEECKTLQEVSEKYNEFIDWYNYQRYHTNSIHEYDPRIAKYIKPIDFFNELIKLENANEL